MSGGQKGSSTGIRREIAADVASSPPLYSTRLLVAGRALLHVLLEGIGLVDGLLLALGVVGVDLSRLRVAGGLATAEACAPGWYGGGRRRRGTRERPRRVAWTQHTPARVGPCRRAPLPSMRMAERDTREPLIAGATSAADEATMMAKRAMRNLNMATAGRGRHVAGPRAPRVSRGSHEADLAASSRGHISPARTRG